MHGFLVSLIKEISYTRVNSKSTRILLSNLTFLGKHCFYIVFYILSRSGLTFLITEANKNNAHTRTYTHTHTHTHTTEQMIEQKNPFLKVFAI